MEISWKKFFLLLYRNRRKRNIVLAPENVEAINNFKVERINFEQSVNKQPETNELLKAYLPAVLSSSSYSSHPFINRTENSFLRLSSENKVNSTSVQADLGNASHTRNSGRSMDPSASGEGKNHTAEQELKQAAAQQEAMKAAMADDTDNPLSEKFKEGELTSFVPTLPEDKKSPFTKAYDGIGEFVAGFFKRENRINKGDLVAAIGVVQDGKTFKELQEKMATA